jgi:transposase
MASAYSQDLRDRVIDAVVRGKMSRRAAAARFGVSESSAIKWARCALVRSAPQRGCRLRDRAGSQRYRGGPCGSTKDQQLNQR